MADTGSAEAGEFAAQKGASSVTCLHPRLPSCVQASPELMAEEGRAKAVTAALRFYLESLLTWEPGHCGPCNNLYFLRYSLSFLGKTSQDCFLKHSILKKFNLKKSFKSSTKNSQLPFMQIHLFLTFAVLGLMFPLSFHTRVFMSRVRGLDMMPRLHFHVNFLRTRHHLAYQSLTIKIRKCKH